MVAESFGFSDVLPVSGKILHTQDQKHERN